MEPVPDRTPSEAAGNRTPEMPAIPQIRRARGYRLYDARGRRYLDLYQDDGRAVLGHRASGVSAAVRAAVSRGLCADYPSVWASRLVRALKTLIPQCVDVRWYLEAARARAAAAAHLSVDATELSVADPVIDGAWDAEVSRWRPFCGDDGGRRHARVLLPVMPPARSIAPSVLCFLEPVSGAVPDSDLVSAFVLHALSRSAYDLTAAQKARNTDHWACFEAPFWRRCGPYFVFTCAFSDYLVHFDRLLQRGILVSPRYPGPSIVPAEYSPGELARFKDYVASGGFNGVA